MFALGSYIAIRENNVVSINSSSTSVLRHVLQVQLFFEPTDTCISGYDAW